MYFKWFKLPYYHLICIFCFIIPWTHINSLWCISVFKSYARNGVYALNVFEPMLDLDLINLFIQLVCIQPVINNTLSVCLFFHLKARLQFCWQGKPCQNIRTGPIAGMEINHKRSDTDTLDKQAREDWSEKLNIFLRVP